MRPRGTGQRLAKYPTGTLLHLTLVVPTHNRADQCAGLLQFLHSNDVSHRLFVANSSEPSQADALSDALGGSVDLRRYASEMPVAEKYLTAVKAVETEFVCLIPDDDITFPHAIDACLAYLQTNRDAVAAIGYVVDFGIHDGVFDIRRVRYFTPTIGADEPLQRLYDLVRRYQPFLWAVFRTEALVAALEASLKMDIIVFQELTIMNAAAAQGKIARLPHIFSLRGMEKSLSAARADTPNVRLSVRCRALIFVLTFCTATIWSRSYGMHTDAATWDRSDPQNRGSCG